MSCIDPGLLFMIRPCFLKTSGAFTEALYLYRAWILHRMTFFISWLLKATDCHVFHLEVLEEKTGRVHLHIYLWNIFNKQCILSFQFTSVLYFVFINHFFLHWESCSPLAGDEHDVALKGKQVNVLVIFVDFLAHQEQRENSKQRYKYILSNWQTSSYFEFYSHRVTYAHTNSELSSMRRTLHISYQRERPTQGSPYAESLKASLSLPQRECGLFKAGCRGPPLVWWTTVHQCMHMQRSWLHIFRIVQQHFDFFVSLFCSFLLHASK